MNVVVIFRLVQWHTSAIQEFDFIYLFFKKKNISFRMYASKLESLLLSKGKNQKESHAHRKKKKKKFF